MTTYMTKMPYDLKTSTNPPIAGVVKVNESSPAKIENYKKIKNYSMQGLCLVFNNNGTPESHWLEPKQMIQVPESFLTEQTNNLHTRRLIQIS